MWIPARIDERNTKRTQASVLRVSLLEIAETAHELFARDVGVVSQEISLGGLSGVVDQDVGVGGHACYCADHVAEERSLVTHDRYCKYCASYSFKI